MVTASDGLVIEARGLHRRFDDLHVLQGVDLLVRRGESVVILGGSGCGKSTLLRTLVGLDRPDEGSVRLFGKDVTGLAAEEMDDVRKRFGILFQSGALLQSLTVGENVALPLRQHTDLDESVIGIMTRLKLDMVGLTGFEHHMPAECSGGMKKRAGLARAIAMDPEILFADEPSAGLDPIVAAEIDDLLIGLKRMMGITQVVVTHHLDSAYKIADKIVMLHDGRVVFEGTPADYQRAEDPMVRQFREGSTKGPIARRATAENILETLLGRFGLVAAKGYTRDEVKIGALVVAAGAVLFVFLLKVGALPKYAETYVVVTEMESVGGLPEKQAPVKFAGKEVGVVERIDYVPEDSEGPARLRVRMRIASDFPLPQFVQATIASATMLGDPHLEIRQVIPPDERYRKREVDGVWVIAGRAPTTLPELLADGRRILEDVKRFTSRLDVVGDTVERIVEGARRIVDDDTFQANVHGTVASWRAAGDEVYGRIGVVADSATEALGTWRAAGATTGATIARVGDRAETLVWRVDDIVARRGDTIAANLETFSGRIANNPSSLIWGGARPGRGPGTSSPTSY